MPSFSIVLLSNCSANIKITSGVILTDWHFLCFAKKQEEVILQQSTLASFISTSLITTGSRYLFSVPVQASLFCFIYLTFTQLQNSHWDLFSFSVHWKKLKLKNGNTCNTQLRKPLIRKNETYRIGHNLFVIRFQRHYHKGFSKVFRCDSGLKEMSIGSAKR